MKKMNNQLLFSFLIILILSGCEATGMSIEIFFNNGEGVKASLDIVDQSRIKVDGDSGAFYVVRRDAVLLKGLFFTEGEFSSYIDEISVMDNVNILKSIPEDSPSYYSFEYTEDGKVQYGFLEKIVDSDLTSILLVAPDLPYSEAEELFRQLHFVRIK